MFHFLLISFFAFSAIFASSVSALLLFIGSLFGLIIPIFGEKIFENFTSISSINDETLLKCYGKPIFGQIIKTPLSVFIYAYLGTYFGYVFSKHKLWNSINNVILFLGITGLLVADIYRIFNACGIPAILIALSLVTGIVWGALWPVMIGTNNHYKPGVSSSDKCGLNSEKTKYQCKLQTDGTLIS